jgi:PAS domain S-box-containing protein
MLHSPHSRAPATAGLPSGALRALCDANPVPTWVCDAQTSRVLAVNDRALEYFGCGREHFAALVSAIAGATGGRPEDDGNSPPQGHRKADGTILAMRFRASDLEVEGRPARIVVALDAGAESRALAAAARHRESDRCFRQLFETASDWFWRTDARGYIVYVSANFEALYGVPVDEMLGRRMVGHSSMRIDLEMERKAISAIKLRQPLRDIVYTHELAGGRIVWVKTSAVPILGGDGVFAGYWGVCKDVTAEIEAERALRDSERQFREILEASSDFYWEQDAQYRYSYVSPGWEKVIGPAAEAVGTRLIDIPGISVDPEMGKMVLRQMKAKQPYRDFVFSRKAPGGKTLWFKASGSPYFDRSGAFCGYRGAGAEITQQVEAGAKVRLAQRQLNEAVVHVTQPIVVYDAEDRVIAFNQAFTDLHRAPDTNTPVCQGVSFRELSEWQLRFGFYPADAEVPAVDLETLLTRYQSEAEHTYHLRGDRWMLVVHRELPGKGRVGLWTDVTALKRAEAERRALERQMYHAQRLEALGTLAGGVAHEINNALVPAIALTKLVAKVLPQASRERRNLDMVVTGAERSRDLVKQILAFSRKQDEESGEQSADMGVVVEEALRLMRATLPSSIRLEEAIAPVPLVSGDPSQLQQVLVNLMTNAAQAIGDAQGRIAVSLRPEADGAALRLSVADSGCGMNEQTLARIFEPFFTTKPVGEGTGLGLSVAHGIIKAHGGRIDVESTPGQGSRFDIVLPAKAA